MRKMSPGHSSRQERRGIEARLRREQRQELKRLHARRGRTAVTKTLPVGSEQDGGEADGSESGDEWGGEYGTQHEEPR